MAESLPLARGCENVVLPPPAATGQSVHARGGTWSLKRGRLAPWAAFDGIGLLVTDATKGSWSVHDVAAICGVDVLAARHARVLAGRLEGTSCTVGSGSLCLLFVSRHTGDIVDRPRLLYVPPVAHLSHARHTQLLGHGLGARQQSERRRLSAAWSRFISRGVSRPDNFRRHSSLRGAHASRTFEAYISNSTSPAHAIHSIELMISLHSGSS
jgi:hypothetical protein